MVFSKAAYSVTGYICWKWVHYKDRTKGCGYEEPNVL